MKIFVTGGTGFIGTHLISRALARGHEVLALRRTGSLPRLPLAREPAWMEAEIGEVESSSLGGCSTLIHLAATGTVPRTATWENCFKINVHDSLALWRTAVAAGLRRFIICGSCFEYGTSGTRYETIPTDAPLEPTGPYHASKAAATMAALGLAVEQQLQMTVLRPFHVFGPGESEERLWPSLRSAALAGKDFPMTEGEQVRDFVPVENVAEAFLNAAEREVAPGHPVIHNVGSGCPQSLRHFAETWWEEFGGTGKLIPGAVPYRPNEVMRYVPQL